MHSPYTDHARLTGCLYLGIAVLGAFSIAYVPSQIIVSGDATATVTNLIQQRGLYRLGIAADVGVMILEILVLSLLYTMFRPVSPTLSLAAAVARLSMVAVMSAMLFFHAGAGLLAEPGGTLTQFTAAQRADLAALFLDIHRAGVWIWQVFFTLHLVLLGALALRSGWVPRLLGWGLILGGAGYLLDSVYAYAFPEAGWLGALRIGLLAIVTLSELGFALWLAARGPRVTPTILAKG